eukprot:SAG11_NODE_24827_length_367_cov_1.332090_1_plen_49_part_10
MPVVDDAALVPTALKNDEPQIFDTFAPWYAVPLGARISVVAHGGEGIYA